MNDNGTDVVLYQPHDDLGKDDYHVWWFTGKEVNIDKRGRLSPRMVGSGNAMFWRCNNPDCTAEAFVRLDVVAALLPEPTP